WSEGRRHGEPVAARATVQQAHAGVAGAQVPADLVLELVPGLWRVPAGRPGEGDLLTILDAAGVTLHGEGEGAVGVLRLARLVHALVGAHRGATAVAVRLAGKLETLDAETGLGRGGLDPGQQRLAGGAGFGDLVQLAPVQWLAEQGAVQRMQPAPAFADQDFAVVVA